MQQPEDALERRLEEIAAAPEGPSIGAFFDFDGTLIDGYSAAAYVKDRMRRRQTTVRELSELLTWSLMDEPGDADFHELITTNVHNWKGVSEEDLAKTWQRLFVRHIAACMFPEAWRLVKAHQRKGHTVVIASSATRYQIAPVAREFDIRHIVCTEVAVKDGRLTGRLGSNPAWGEGKAAATRTFAKVHGIELDASYAYANGDEDVAFLSSVGQPMAVNPAHLLQAKADAESWPQANFAMRRKTTLAMRLGTAACYASMAAVFATGFTAFRLGMPRQRALNFVTSVATELGLAAAGIELRITGEENLWKERPAVFIFNHQSPLDLVIGIALMRRNVTGVVKKEVKDMLGWGQFLKFADAAFVDRENAAKAIEALAPAVEKLRNGLSLGICPEGTRSYSPKLGQFKKGAFHMAMQAGVPIVPVVLRNAGDVMHRDATWMRSGVVDVCALPPISVQHWTRENLDQHIAEVRQRFVDTLQHWPGTTQDSVPAARKAAA